MQHLEKPQPHGYTLCTHEQRGNEQLPHPRGYTFIYPRTKRERATSTPSRVYFYVPANKDGYNNSHTQSRGYTFIYPRTKRDTTAQKAHTRNLAGILLYTHEQRGTDKSPRSWGTRHLLLYTNFWNKGSKERSLFSQQWCRVLSFWTEWRSSSKPTSDNPRW